MTAPTRSFHTNFGRFYAHPSSGVPSLMSSMNMDEATWTLPTAPKPSVTNVLKVLDEGFLPSYYAKLVATYAVEHRDAIAAQADKFGDDLAIGVLKAIPGRQNGAAAIGDEVHAAIDAWAHGEFTDPDDFSTTTAKAMFKQFLEFTYALSEEDPDWQVVRTEFTVWSYTHGYAGTGDLLVRFKDKLCLWDTKTGNNVYPKTAMQCAALANADVILEEDGAETKMPVIEGLGVLHVRPRSVKLYEFHKADEAFEAFLALKTAFDWLRFHKRDTLAPEPVFRFPNA